MEELMEETREDLVGYFDCDCCGMDYRDFEMNEVGEHYICDTCVEEVELAM